MFCKNVAPSYMFDKVQMFRPCLLSLFSFPVQSMVYLPNGKFVTSVNANDPLNSAGETKEML